MDRYTILITSIVLTLFLFTVFDVGDEDIKITGFADDIHESNSGYVFTLNTSDGSKIKAFSKNLPDDELHIFHGDFSSDGSMFFVSRTD